MYVDTAVQPRTMHTRKALATYRIENAETGAFGVYRDYLDALAICRGAAAARACDLGLVTVEAESNMDGEDDLGLTIFGIRNKARRRSSSCAARPMLRKSRAASIPAL